MKGETQNMCEAEKAKTETLHALLTYHHDAMEARRSIGFKAFLSLIALDLILLKGAVDFRQSVNDLTSLKAVVVVGYWILCFLYFAFMYQIEKNNRFNRIKYVQLEKLMWSEVGLTPGGPPPSSSTESIRRTLVLSWAGTWPVITIALFSLGCTLVVLQLKN